jgi:predicted dehydrogenase
MTKQIGVGIIGCGNIAGPYADDFANYPEINFIGTADIDPSRAAALADKHGVIGYESIAALLANPAIELVVNLTAFAAHKDVTEQALRAGKHVYSEKPLATPYAAARSLVTLADELGLRLGCSPFTLMGQAQQTAWKLIRDGRLGQVRVVYAEANQGRIETWHPAPQAFYDIGVVYDVGVYPLTLLVSMLGPVRRVQAYATVVLPDRVTTGGEPYHVTTPDWVVAILELENGAQVRLTSTFYVPGQSRQSGIEFHGDAGSMALGSTYLFDADVAYAPYGEELADQPLVQPGEPGVPWGRGVYEMALAMLADRPHRFSGELAAHIVEVMDGIKAAYETGEPVSVESSFRPPSPMEWAA